MCLVFVWLLTALQLHDAGLHIHGEVLQIHGAGQDQSDSANQQENKHWCQSPNGLLVISWTHVVLLHDGGKADVTP